jgi:hypothetical protein
MEGLAVNNFAKDHLDFAERLLGMFEPADDRRLGWKQRIQRAGQRLADKHYYLAVVGEFNAGKSTLINALLQAELFAASTEPTTAAAVWVRYGRRLVVRVGFRGGRTWMSTADVAGDPARWRKLRKIGDQDRLAAGLTTEQVCDRLSKLDSLEALRVVTTDPVVAGDVLSIEVEYPSSLLGSGLVLIDTPGAGSGDSQHGDEHTRIARQVVSDADAAVVITLQNKLLPESLVSFLTATLDEGLLARCAFVVTRADQAEADEFDDLRRDGAERITSLLGLADPPVAWAAPLQVVRGLRGEDLDDDAGAWVERFDRTRRWLRRIVEERRPMAVADTALRLIQELLNELDAELIKDLSHLEWQQRELNATVPADMTDFLSGQVDSGIQVLERAERQALREISSMTWRAGESLEEAIREKIEPCGNGKAIRRALDEDVPPLVEAELRYLVRQAQSVVHDRLNGQLGEVTDELRTAFAAEYAKLERIDAAPASGGVSELRVARTSIDNATFDDAKAIAIQDSQRDALAIGGGASAGLLIGTMILPGLGTIVGGAIGAVLGGAFTRNIEAVRADAVEKASVRARGLADTVGERLAEATRKSSATPRAQLREQAVWYRSAYGKTISAIRDAHDAEQHALQTRHDQLTWARHEAAERRTAVAADRARLLSVDGIEMKDPFGGSHD